jgi:hypothetical protein
VQADIQSVCGDGLAYSSGGNAGATAWYAYEVGTGRPWCIARQRLGHTKPLQGAGRKFQGFHWIQQTISYRMGVVAPEFLTDYFCSAS